MVPDSGEFDGIRKQVVNNLFYAVRIAVEA